MRVGGSFIIIDHFSIERSVTD